MGSESEKEGSIRIFGEEISEVPPTAERSGDADPDSDIGRADEKAVGARRWRLLVLGVEIERVAIVASELVVCAGL